MVNKIPDTDGLWRDGIVLVGCGGTCGKDKRLHYESSSSNWDIKWPGGGGGGGGVGWAILHVRNTIWENDK